MTTEIENIDFNNDIEILPIEEWLNFASGVNESVFVALPLIQRGSVWKPNQIIDLWDTLLRGMPMGSLIFSKMPTGILVRRIGKKEMEPSPAGSIGLIDGQQRTLAMLIAWSEAGEMDRRIWVDFADKQGDGHLFRLRVTTINQPFGFQKAKPSAKLSLSEKRDALEAFEKENKVENPNKKELFEKAKPHLSKLPIDLRLLVESWKNTKGDKSIWIREIEDKLDQIKNEKIKAEELAHAKSNVSKFTDALIRLFNLKIPLLKVDSSIFNPVAAGVSDNNDETIDPPLAVLFKRIGTGGTPLSDADYVYSVIKYHLPEAYSLVEGLHAGENIASLLSATDLVMTAVRLAAAEVTLNNKQMTDWESPTKQEFHRLIKLDGFLENKFLPLIKQDVLQKAFISLTELLQYENTHNSKGLPIHAFPVLSRPLVQVLIRWIRCVQLEKPNDYDLKAVLNQSREDVLRFIMYWQLCVVNPRKASLIAFKQLKEGITCFPALEIYKALLDGKVAIPIIAPGNILEINKNVIYTADSDKLRGLKRFSIKPDATEEEKQVIQLYQRWWGNGNRHIHPLLLWLQREAVAEFEGNPIAGKEEDTPYDYDHICPINHWGDWTGAGTNADSLMQFIDKINDGKGHVYIGNSIGNIRVWDSSKNRSDGKDAPNEKLKLDDEIERAKLRLLELSAIDLLQIEGWKACSAGERSWNKGRALAFQQVVEQRAFALYNCYYNDLGFSVWTEKFPEAAEHSAG
jgi:hypothetical protein